MAWWLGQLKDKGAVPEADDPVIGWIPLVTLAGIVLGTAVALATLVPMMKGLTGEGPYIPPLVHGAFAGTIVVLGLTAAGFPARAALRGDTLEE